MRRLLAFAAIALVTACSSPSTLDADALDSWTPLPGRATEVPCGDLYDGWADPSAERPLRCWTYEESDGLPATFRELVDSFENQLSGDVEVAPACQGATAERRSFTCTASWSSGDAVVTVTSGVTVHSMEEMVDEVPPVSYSDPTLAGTHEVILWVGDAAPVDDLGIYTDAV
ncbi:hypothetical protein [Demequina subtropica]|uniref:hypothetical protein n=1 Tax=Demequina subtropica TaxID=1638989 RepID=UPI00078205DD|nr:hypothetical protein [Demequina subtropica]